jgi:hypothetical protein
MTAPEIAVTAFFVAVVAFVAVGVIAIFAIIASDREGRKLLLVLAAAVAFAQAVWWLGIHEGKM